MDKTFLTKMKRSTYEQYLLQDEILKGKYGLPGEPFMTTQKLAESRGVSLVTAHNIMSGLCDAGYIELKGKKYYLSYSEQAKHLEIREKVIGLILPHINNEFFSSIADNVIRLARQKGYRVLVMNTSYSAAEEKEILTLFKELGVAGIISCTPTDPENVPIYRDFTIPCIFLAHSDDSSHKSSVQVNNFPVSQKIAQHLIDQGYRSFLYIGTQHIQIENDIRYIAFQTKLNQEGFSLNKENIILFSQNDKLDTKLLTSALEGQTEPIGVFCYHDLIAVQLYRICSKIGKRIPEDVGVVGFDDLSVSTCLYPPLTTVRYRITSMADTALKLLFEKIKNPDNSYDNYYIEPSLIIRKSTDLPSRYRTHT